jgi:hypothetical protein
MPHIYRGLIISCANGFVHSVMSTCYRSSTIRRAASMRRMSSSLRQPTLFPSRPGSIAAVCSASTRVRRPAISTSGRKLAARADVDVGATSHVDSGSWSDWTTTAYREPDCSWPRLRRGAPSRKTSPRTQRLHVAKHLHGLGAVCLVTSELFCLSANRRGSLSARGIDEGRSNRRRYWCPVSG